jgi:hypothetical protein
MPDESNQGNQGTPQTNGPSSGAQSASTSSNPPKTYTEVEYQKAISDALSKQGREHKAVLDPITQENTTLKSQLATNQSLIKESTDKIAEVRKQMESLAGDDPDKKKLLATLAELEGKRVKLDADRQALEAEKVQHQELVRKAGETMREFNIRKLAGEHEGGDPAKLTELCNKLGVTGDDKIAALADTLWPKKTAAPLPAQVTNPDSGVTSGGSEDLSQLSPREKIEKGLEQSRKK